MRVLLADDRGLLVEELRTVLHTRGVEVLGVAKGGSECVRQARKLRPDVILMDSRMPSRAVLSATETLMAELPDTKVLILTAAGGGHDLFEAVRSGSTGLLLKTVEGGRLRDLLHAVIATSARQGGRGQKPAPEAVPVPGCPEDVRMLAPEPLSERQEEVLTLLAQGLSYKEIGDRVALTPRTVKYHMGEIMRKLHLRNRAQVLAYAGSRGLGAELRPASQGEGWPPCVPSGVCPLGH